jgi:hypothetical protein
LNGILGKLEKVGLKMDGWRDWDGFCGNGIGLWIDGGLEGLDIEYCFN